MVEAQDLEAIGEGLVVVHDVLGDEIEDQFVQDALVMMRDRLTTVVVSVAAIEVDLLLVPIAQVMAIGLREVSAAIEVETVAAIEYKAQDDSAVEMLLQQVVLVVLSDEIDHSLVAHPEVEIAHIATTIARKLVLAQVNTVLLRRTLRCSSQEISITSIR